MVLGLGFAWELGYSIAVPAILFGLAGGYIDRYLGTSPLFLLILISIAFVISTVGIARRIRTITKRMPKILPKPKTHVDSEAAKEQEILHDLFRPPHP